MKITYIGHSGFLVETDSCYYMFDYFVGVLPPLDGDKAVIVFSSHAHRDHYNPQIFDLLREAGVKHIIAVLSDDISHKVYPDHRGEIAVIPVSAHRMYELPFHTKIYTLRSTDEGVAFLLQCPEGTIYHAGDLNDWMWPGESEAYNRDMTQNYRQEIGRLNQYRREILGECAIDAAFVPLDPRQEELYECGMLGFLKEIPAVSVYPMHFWEKPEVIDRFRESYPEYAHLIKQSNTCS